MVGNIDRPAFSVFELNVDAMGRTDRSGCPAAIKNARATQAGAGCHDTIRRSSRSAAEHSLLTAPFIEPPRLRREGGFALFLLAQPPRLDQGGEYVACKQFRCVKYVIALGELPPGEGPRLRFS